MHNRKAGIAFVVTGVVLLLAALLFLLYLEWRNAAEEKKNSGIYDEIHRLIEQQKAETEPEASPMPELQFHVPAETVRLEETDAAVPGESAVPVESTPPETVVTIDGNGYLGLLELPSLELSMPILADWDYEKLNIAPCRHFGSAAGNDLVIAGHNYRRHFLYLYKLAIGDDVRFTTMDGTAYDYIVLEKRTLNADEVDTVLYSEYDLILYTCTYSGTERTAVFCERIETE